MDIEDEHCGKMTRRSRVSVQAARFTRNGLVATGRETVQVERRMGRDSNPRYPCEYGSFQDCCLKPLGHPSGSILGICLPVVFVELLLQASRNAI